MLVELSEIVKNDLYSILSLELNNPSSRNAMTWEMGLEFLQTVESIPEKFPKARAVILSGKNDVFSAGGDLNFLKSFAKKTIAENERDMEKFYSFFLSIRSLPIPVIGAINGHAIGAGFSLALAADIRIFANEGKYCFNFVKLGIHPGMGSSFIAKELLGASKANELLMLAKELNGIMAKEYGLCQSSVPLTEVKDKALELAEEISSFSPLALSLLKQNSYDKQGLGDALKREAFAQSRNFVTKDFQETILSIEQKRKPVFQGV